METFSASLVTTVTPINQERFDLKIDCRIAKADGNDIFSNITQYAGLKFQDSVVGNTIDWFNRLMLSVTDTLKDAGFPDTDANPLSIQLEGIDEEKLVIVEDIFSKVIDDLLTVGVKKVEKKGKRIDRNRLNNFYRTNRNKRANAR